MSDRKLVRIGFWFSNSEPHYPMPIESNNDNSSLSRRLKDLENEPETDCIQYRGLSPCRLCGAVNGSGEFKYDMTEKVYVWPEGIHHYLLQHGIEPPKELIELLEATTE